ncbi:NAD-dependent epimerase/dehydratase family protein [Paenibacillus sp. NPDC056579]|uniref:NAD-dependent epimerase/dehydratase family protein n=1 Tax=Paenibacillus sp. NPDC056579 TaxID=3345871 RepID=UPI0036896C90
MNIFVAGCTGAIGRRMVPELVRRGHEVTGMIRNPDQSELIERIGARAVIADVFDREAVFKAVEQARPEVVIHQLTSLSTRNFADNARIRIEGTRNLADAALSSGVKRMLAQSISWVYEPGEGPASEAVPLDMGAPSPRKETVAAVHALESAAAEVPEHVILRYGMLYGPGTWYERGGYMDEVIRGGQAPSTDGVASFVHVEDAAMAAVAALEWPSGPVNIVDDEPAKGTEWLPVFAEAISAQSPEITQGGSGWERGASNAKARKEYGWQPLYPSWRTGFALSMASKS